MSAGKYEPVNLFAGMSMQADPPKEEKKEVAAQPQAMPGLFSGLSMSQSPSTPADKPPSMFGNMEVKNTT